MRAVKAGSMFIAYSNPSSDWKRITTVIPKQYWGFGDVFEKKNENILSEHRPYNCFVDLSDGAQPEPLFGPLFGPPFGPIYNLSQKKLSLLR